ncbi:MAG: 1-(5-phosphoribosyl)-5-[(5-phosphoribosylamino)methylideneamino]imidazole-4-carboxamide isomerase [Candidatus Margulisiibacteriota bacterium]
MRFVVIPAVDILGGKCVRLEKGDYEKVTVYSEDPVSMAKKWQDQGYKRLHLVDLDGAREGIPRNIKFIKAIAAAVSVPVQVGGGIRQIDTIRELFESGVNRVILGTVAFENLSFIKTVCELFGENIAVSIDAKKDIVLTKGWLETTSLKAVEAAKKLVSMGIKRFVYTDISRDGMMAGPNIKGIKQFASSVNASVIASGGVTTGQDIEKLSKLGKNIEGCIVGKALYEGKIKIDE